MLNLDHNDTENLMLKAALDSFHVLLNQNVKDEERCELARLVFERFGFEEPVTTASIVRAFRLIETLHDDVSVALTLEFGQIWSLVNSDELKQLAALRNAISEGLPYDHGLLLSLLFQARRAKRQNERFTKIAAGGRSAWM